MFTDTSDYRTQLFSILSQASKPGRYIGGEPNMVRKDLGKVKVRFALAFPEIYEIGMSHHGLRILYHLLNRIEDVYAERVFAPWVDMADLMRQQKLPLLSLETKTPIAQFDIAGFSMQSELTYTNLLHMLELAGIPLLSAERAENHPLVCAGGPCMANPAPLADFVDFFVIGDGEEAVGDIMEALRQAKSCGWNRGRKLEALSQLKGIYVPAIHIAPQPWGDEPQPGRPQLLVQRRWVEKLSRDFYPTRPLVPVVDIVQDRISVEIMRGCTEGCRFCQAGFFYRPVREMNGEDILAISRDTYRNTGTNEIGLLSLSTANYSQIEPLSRELARRFSKDNVSISLPSLRADKLSVAIAENVGEVRRNGFTFAPEAGSSRLRSFINKNISDDDLFQAIETAYAHGWNLVKLYFMIGLPSETDEDVREIVRLIAEVGKIGKKVKPGKRVNASIGTFVPKAFTPFQWDRFENLTVVGDRLQYLKEAVRFPFAKLKWHDPHGCLIEAALARGDRALGKVLLKAHQLGCVFDGWEEHFHCERWLEAFAQCQMDPAFYLREIGRAEVLPWDFIDLGVSKKYLLKERERSDSGIQTPDCKWGDCHGCGIPGNYADIQLASPLGLPPASMEQAVESVGKPKVAPDQYHPYILRYWKEGPARFLSHLNVMRLMERAMLRAGLRLRHTEGFNPHPRLAFSPALALGVASHAEYIHFELPDLLPDGVIQQMNEALMEGMEVKSIVPYEGKGKWRVTKPLQATYRARTQCQGADELATRIKALENEIKEGPVQTEAPSGMGMLERVSQLRLESENPLCFTFTLTANTENGSLLKPKDFLEQLLKCPPELIAAMELCKEELSFEE